MTSPTSSPPSWNEAIMQRVGGFGHLFDYNRNNEEEHPPVSNSIANGDDHVDTTADEDRDHHSDHREEEDLLNEILGMTANSSYNNRKNEACRPSSPAKTNAHVNEHDQAQDHHEGDMESVMDFEMDPTHDDLNTATMTMMIDPSSSCKTNSRLADLRKEAMGMAVDSPYKNEEQRPVSHTNVEDYDDDHVDTAISVAVAVAAAAAADPKRDREEEADEMESISDFEMDASHDDPNYTATTLMIDIFSSSKTMKNRLANLRKEAMGMAADDSSSTELSEASSSQLDNDKRNRRKVPGYEFDYGATVSPSEPHVQTSVPWNANEGDGGRHNSMDTNMMEVDFPNNFLGPSSSPSESGSLSGYSSMDETRSYYGYATILETTGVIALPPYVPRLADFPWVLHFVSNIRRASQRKRLGECSCQQPHLTYSFQDLSLLSLHHNVITRFLCVAASQQRHQQKMIDCDYSSMWTKATCLATGLQEYHQLLKRAERASRPPPPPYHYSLLETLQNKGGKFYVHKGRHPLGSKRSRIETKKRELGALIPYVDPSSSNERAASSSSGIWIAAYQVAFCIYQCQQKKLLGHDIGEKRQTMLYEDNRGTGSCKRSFSALAPTTTVNQEMTAENHHRMFLSQQPTIPRLRGKRVLLLDPKGSISNNKKTKLGSDNDPVGREGGLADATTLSKTKTIASVESASRSKKENDDMRAKETSLLSRFGLATRREIQDQVIGGGRVAPALSRQKPALSSSRVSSVGDTKLKPSQRLVGESSCSTLQDGPPTHTGLRYSSPSALNKHVKRRVHGSESPTTTQVQKTPRLQATGNFPSRKLCVPLKNNTQTPQAHRELESDENDHHMGCLVSAVKQSVESRSNLTKSNSHERAIDDPAQRPLSPTPRRSFPKTKQDDAVESKKDRKRRRKEEKKARKTARSQRRAKKRQKKAPIATVTPIPKVPLKSLQKDATFPDTNTSPPDEMNGGYMKNDEPSNTAARASVSSVVHNHPAPLPSIPTPVLCSERFIESWGSVVAELSKTKQRSDKSESFSFVDTELLDMLGVDIENSMGEAVVVCRAGTDEMESFLRSFVDIVATARYSVLHLVVLLDVKHYQLQAYVQRLHNAVLRYKAVPTTYVNLELVSPNSVSTCLADLLSTNNGTSKSLDLEKWLIDERSRERIRFLISIVPTLGLLGAIQCLAFTTTDREVPSSDTHFHGLLTSKALRGRIQECVHRKSPQTSTINSTTIHHLQVAIGTPLTQTNFS